MAKDDFDIFELDFSELAKIKIASKQTQTVYSSPSSVSVVTRQQLKSMGITNLQALLNFISGFQSTRDIEQGTANRISVRGRSTALSESILLQIDGQKINDLYTGGISILNRMLDLGHVKQIEIIRGPGSALYGSNAFLGVINIITESNINEGTFGLDSIGGVFGNIFYSQELFQNSTIDLYLSLFEQSGDEYELTDIYGISDHVKDPIKGGDLYVKYHLGNWLFTGRYMERELNDFIPLGSFGKNINKESTQQWSISSQYKGQLLDVFEYELLLSHSEDKWDTFALFIPEKVEISPDFSLDEDFVGGPFLTSKTSKISFDTAYKVNSSQFISLGVSYESSSITEVYTSTSHDLFTLESYGEIVKLKDEQSFNVKERRDVASLYIQDQVKLGSQWELTAGIRFDNYNDFGSSTNPRIALIWKPENKNSIKLMYGTAFRAPNFLELYDRNNYTDFGNVNLQAEEVTTTEIAWLRADHSWKFEITAFNNNFRDLIILGEPVESIENPFFAPTFANNNGKKSRGIESELSFNLDEFLSMRVIWNWFTHDSDINVARNSGALVIDYQWLKTQFNLSSYYRGINEFIVNQGSYIVTNINVRYVFSKSVMIHLAIDNVLDESFNTQSIVYSEGIENRGRVFKLSLDYLF